MIDLNLVQFESLFGDIQNIFLFGIGLTSMVFFSVLLLMFLYHIIREVWEGLK